MASVKILVCCLILACFVSMANADVPRSKNISRRDFVWHLAYSNPISKECEPPLYPGIGAYWETFLECFIYGGHTYYLSRPYSTDIFWTQRNCQIIGGYLVQIDTVDEFTAIKNFIKNITIKDYNGKDIIIDGTDIWKEGAWTFFNIKELPVQDWYPGTPNGGDCLCLADGLQKMFDVNCFSDPGHYRYMCEVPA